jgi:hypothetical protein
LADDAGDGAGVGVERSQVLLLRLMLERAKRSREGDDTVVVDPAPIGDRGQGLDRECGLGRVKQRRMGVLGDDRQTPLMGPGR